MTDIENNMKRILSIARKALWLAGMNTTNPVVFVECQGALNEMRDILPNEDCTLPRALYSSHP